MDANEEAKWLRYCGELVNVWLRTTPEDFPLDAEEKLGWIAPLGIPRTTYWAKFESKDELWGRIRMLGQILNAEKITGQGENDIVEVQL